MPCCYHSKRKGGRGVLIEKGKSGCGIKRMFRDGLAGLGKDAERVKDDVAPRMKKATDVTVQLCYIYKENTLSSYPEHKFVYIT